MAEAFRRKGARYVGKFDQEEREVVVHLLSQVRELVTLDEAPATGDPIRDLLDGLGREPASPQEIAGRDPALRRLLPQASRDDDALAQDFRALAEHDIRRAKAANLAIAIHALSFEGGSRVELDQRQAQALMIAVGDVRLMLGERLELRTDEDAERLQEVFDEGTEHDGERRLLAAYYEFLTWMQESLALTLTA
ncbi:DUF2017 domain-containing protein [Allobranchiibius sp. CTAmp26]|uniref:DUF2017 domain-containing protein n=1 Tax=Allobranchiibius sp. CTAmp26 TaxID=2815214 RepID=UPI001AA15438|nr:DUF2017 domain-containing protein [Allobranchiibius sp. CTAmp26]MBO1756197.1 DUF2017 domain-containing protein [Allobranchiibius sp. CTAmp26]